MNIEEMKERLKSLLKEDRFIHTISTAKEAVKLAKLYGVDENKAYIAALLHDNGKNISYEESILILKEEGYEINEDLISNSSILHQYVGCILAKRDFGIEDSEILDAIKYHTTGRENMSLLGKIVFLADVTEEGREYEGVEEIRSMVYENKDINKAIIMSLDRVITFVISKNKTLHSDTIKARNYLINHS